MKKPTTKKGKMAKVSKVMKEFKAGTLNIVVKGLSSKTLNKG
jgi:hypothetical protein